jgi:hypothetical protein
MCGNTSKLGDASGSPGKSSLFFLTAHVPLESDYPAIGVLSWQSTLLFGVSGALSSALENPRARLIDTPGRTHNRIRSPR